MIDKELNKQLMKAGKLYREKEYLESYNLFKEIYDKNPKAFRLGNKRSFAWAIYRVFGKDIHEENLENIELISELIKQSDNSKEDGPCAYTLCIMNVADFLHKNGHYFEVIKWLDKLNPNFLNEFDEETARDVRYKSKREQYYTLKYESLNALGEYEEVIKICKEALKNIAYSNNKIWIKRRMALAYKELYQYDESLNILKEVFNDKKEWFIQNEIAENYYAKGDLDNALKYTVDAALNFGDIDKKVKLYEFMGELLEEKGLYEEALQHYKLAYSIRFSNGWGINNKLLEKVENKDKEFKDKNYRKIEKCLKSKWESLKFNDQTRIYGEVRRLFPKSGFIEGQDYNSYYFQMRSVNGNKSKIKVGTRVSFFTEEGFDKKKGKKTINAVNINIED